MEEMVNLERKVRKESLEEMLVLMRGWHSYIITSSYSNQVATFFNITIHCSCRERGVHKVPAERMVLQVERESPVYQVPRE